MGKGESGGRVEGKGRRKKGKEEGRLRGVESSLRWMTVQCFVVA